MAEPGAIAQAAETQDVSRGAAVDIVIVNWNSREQLRECLDSIAAHGGPAVRRVYVVDNGSADGSERAAENRDGVELIRTGRNLGFGKACNLAADRSSAGFLLFLNPDAELRAGALQGALEYMRGADGRDAGVVGIRLVGRDGDAHRCCARFPDWSNFVGNSLGLTRIARRWFAPITLIEFDHLTSRDVDHVMGAFYLIRRDLFVALGGFDEDFFVYLEDLDLSRRVVDSGARIHYLADVAAYHKQGGTSEQVKAHRLYYALQSNIIYAFKHLPRRQAWSVAVITLAIEPVSRAGRALFRRSIDELRFTLQGFAMLYRALPSIGRHLRDTQAGKGARR